MRRKKTVTQHQGNPIIFKIQRGMVITHWKVVKIGKDYIQFEYTLGEEKKESEGYNYYVLYKQKIWRAKKCYICAHINAKEKMPVIIETYFEGVKPVQRGEYYRFVYEDFAEKKYYCLFYPRFKKMYVAKIIKL
ncbi:MAG: hypothetical protein HFJ43_05410 [Clostridia bacterium]|nr:hypothetical protein [Clostridia bacterium]